MWEGKFCRSRLLDQFATFSDLFMGILKIGEPNLAECFPMIGWSIWHKRNATRLQQASLPYSQVYSTAMSSLLEFFAITDSQHSPKSVARPNSGIPLCLLVIWQILTELCLRTSQQQVSESLFGTAKGRLCWVHCTMVQPICNRHAQLMSLSFMFLNFSS